MPPIGFAAVALSPPNVGLGSWASKAFKSVSNAFQSVGDEVQRTWDRVRAEASRAGNRVGDELKRAVQNVGSVDWWTDTVGRTISRAGAIKLFSAIATYVFPPIALVVQTVEVFLAKYKADFVATPEFWATAAPDETNAFMAEVVKSMNSIDLFQTLPTLALTELTVQAQNSKAKRDSLRMKIATIQAKWATKRWAIVAKHVYQTAQAVIITVVTWGVGSAVVAAIQAGQLLISAATTALQFQMMRELTRIAKDEVAQAEAAQRAAIDADMAALEAEIAALRAQIAAAGSSAPVGPNTAAEAYSAVGAEVPTNMSGSMKIAIGAAVLGALYVLSEG